MEAKANSLGGWVAVRGRSWRTMPYELPWPVSVCGGGVLRWSRLCLVVAPQGCVSVGRSYRSCQRPLSMLMLPLSALCVARRKFSSGTRPRRCAWPWRASDARKWAPLGVPCVVERHAKSRAQPKAAGFDSHVAAGRARRPRIAV